MILVVVVLVVVVPVVLIVYNLMVCIRKLAGGVVECEVRRLQIARDV